MEPHAYEAMARIEGEHWWFVGRRAILRSLIQDRVRPPENARILEAGCGTGGNLELLSDFGQLEAFEYDGNARAISIARSVAPVKEGRLPDGIDHIEGSFDLIALLDVLEHLEYDAESLRTLASRLSPSGKIILTVPAIEWLWSQHDVVHHHHRRYSRRSLARTIGEAGLEVEYMSHFNSILLPAAIVQRFAARFSSDGPDLDIVPARPVNTLLTTIFAAERGILKMMRLPAGLSLCAICSLKQ